MIPAHEKTEILQLLQKEILSLQGARNRSSSRHLHTGLCSIEKAFPNNTFPTGAVHEFTSHAPQDTAATSGFITALLSRFTKPKGVCLWVSTRRTLFPPALKLFGLAPDSVIFIDLNREKEALWAIEEALKCEAVSAVVGELRTLSFTESRRLQLTVENSRVTGFIHCCNNSKTQNASAAVSRWHITSIASFQNEEEMPGIGFPAWDVRLLKVRNGRPGNWRLAWVDGRFQPMPAFTIASSNRIIRKAV